MKIAILKNQLSSYGGLEKYTLQLIQAFIEKGCQVSLLTTGVPRDIPSECNVVLMSRPCPINFLKILQFDKWCQEWLRENPVDVVFGMESNSYQTHYRAGNGVYRYFFNIRKQTEPWYKRISLWANPKYRILLDIEKKAFTHPDLKILFTNSAMVKKEILNYYPGINENKISVVHNGVEWHKIESDFQYSMTNLEEIRASLGLNPKAFQFLFVGIGFRRKGLEQLLAGLVGLNQTFQDWQLSVVGYSKDFNYFTMLVHKLGLAKQIKFFGRQSNTYQFYQAADVTVIPSLYDPFANVTVEALAFGNFVVSSEFNGGKEVLKPETGIIIEDLFNTESITHALTVALNHRKTNLSAEQIRNSVKELDFSLQLKPIVDQILQTT